MTKKVRKAFGENPETVAVLATQVTFDAEGFAEVEDEVADVFGQIPGYEVEEIEEAQEAPSEEDEEEADAPEEPTSEEDEEDEEEEEAPAPKTPKRPARKAPVKK
jgi:hypothetical protein